MSSVSWNNLQKGIRFRLTLVYSTLFGLLLIIFAYIITDQYFESGRQDFDSNLINYAIDVSNYLKIDASGVDVILDVPESEINKRFPFLIDQTYYSVRDISGRMMARSLNKQVFPDIPYDPSLPLKQNYTHRLLTIEGEKDIFRAVNLKITNSSGKEMILQVAATYNATLDREHYHLLTTLLVIPFLVLGTSVFSFIIAGNAMQPIKMLTDTANNIAAKNLSLRVPVAGTGDEVEDLGKTLNSLLERLEVSFSAQENFVANASHQLNTPLSIIKGELDVLQSKERSQSEIYKFHQSLREELERLIELVKNMLLISRVKSGLESFIFSPIRLDDLLLSTSSRLLIKAKEKNITVRYNIDETLSSSDLEVMGERQLLDAVFENILDNAIKYSPQKSIIRLDIKKISEKTEVWIRDEGPGMNEQNFIDCIKTRFNRGSVEIPGTGIGLYIANKIAIAHNAAINYQNNEPKGGCFKIKF